MHARAHSAGAPGGGDEVRVCRCRVGLRGHWSGEHVFGPGAAGPARRSVTTSSSDIAETRAAALARLATPREWPARWGDFMSTRSAMASRTSSSSAPLTRRDSTGSACRMASHLNERAQPIREPRAHPVPQIDLNGTPGTHKLTRPRTIRRPSPRHHRDRSQSPVATQAGLPASDLHPAGVRTPSGTSECPYRAGDSLQRENDLLRGGRQYDSLEDHARTADALEPSHPLHCGGAMSRRVAPCRTGAPRIAAVTHVLRVLRFWLTNE